MFNCYPDVLHVEVIAKLLLHLVLCGFIATGDQQINYLDDDDACPFTVAINVILCRSESKFLEFRFKLLMSDLTRLLEFLLVFAELADVGMLSLPCNNAVTAFI